MIQKTALLLALVLLLSTAALAAGVTTAAETIGGAAEFCEGRGIDPASASFSDTADADIRLIAATGIVTGYPDGTFRPDAAQISEYAKDGVSFAAALGLMNGHANGSFAPRAQITREQAVITVMNAWRKLG